MHIFSETILESLLFCHSLPPSTPEESKQIVCQFSCAVQDSVVYQYHILETSKQFDKDTRS